MVRIDIEQGSHEWHVLRGTKISATRASIILGLNPYQNAYQLWEILEGLREEDPPNEAMLRGSKMEPLAREAFIEQTGIKVEPAVFISDTCPWAMCSLDGISEDGKLIIEIKCGVKSFKDAAKDKIPDYYYAQVQHQMWVANVDQVIMVFFDGKNLINKHISRDQPFIDRMIALEEKFYYDWKENIPPKVEETPIWEISYEEYVTTCDNFMKTISEELKGQHA